MKKTSIVSLIVLIAFSFIIACGGGSDGSDAGDGPGIIETNTCGDSYTVSTDSWEFSLSGYDYLKFKTSGKLILHQANAISETEVEISFLDCYRGLDVDTFTAEDARGYFPGYDWQATRP